MEGGGPMIGRANGIFNNTSYYFISYRTLRPQGLIKIHPSTKMGAFSEKCKLDWETPNERK